MLSSDANQERSQKEKFLHQSHNFHHGLWGKIHENGLKNIFFYVVKQQK